MCLYNCLFDLILPLVARQFFNRKPWLSGLSRSRDYAPDG